MCYYCNEKFSKGHECKKPQNLLMVAEKGPEDGLYNEEPMYDTYPKETEVPLAGRGNNIDSFGNERTHIY